jgi:hypothetical protein
MAAKLMHNWPALLAEYDTRLLLEPNFTQIAFCNEKKLDESMLSREFSRLRKSRAQIYIDQAQSKLGETAHKAANKLSNLIEMGSDDNVQFKASVAVLDRVGISPQAVQVNIQNSNQMAVVMPPMFGSAPGGLKDLLGAEE